MGPGELPTKFSELHLNEACPEESHLLLRAREGKGLRDQYREVEYNYLYSTFGLTLTSFGRVRSLHFPPLRVHRGDLGLGLLYRGRGALHFRRLEDMAKELLVKPGQWVIRGSDGSLAYSLTFYPSMRDPRVAFLSVEVENISQENIEGAVLFEARQLTLDNLRDMWAFGSDGAEREDSRGVSTWHQRGLRGLWAGLATDPGSQWRLDTRTPSPLALEGSVTDLREAEGGALLLLPLQRSLAGMMSNHLPPGGRCQVVVAFAWGRSQAAVRDSLTVARRLWREEYQEFLVANRRMARDGLSLRTGIKELDLLFLFSKVQARWMHLYGRAHPILGHPWIPAGAYTFFGAFERDGFLGGYALGLLGEPDALREELELFRALRAGPRVPHEVWWRVSRRGLAPWKCKQGAIGDAEPFYILRAYYYFAFTHDREFLIANIDDLVATMEYMEGFRDADGLLASNEIANYAELRPLRCGDRSVNPLYNTLAAWAYERGAELCHLAGRPVEAARFAAAGARLRERLDPALFDPALGYYIFERVRGRPQRVWRHRHVQHLDALLYRPRGDEGIPRRILDQIPADGWARAPGLVRSVPASDPWCESDEAYWLGADWNLFNFKVPWLCFRYRHNMDWALDQLRALAAHLVSYEHPAIPGEHSADNGLFMFSLASLAGCVLEGLLGLRVDAGGLTLNPCRLASGMAIRNFVLRGPDGGRTTFDIRVDGVGDQIKTVHLDGRPVPSARVPATALDGRLHELHVTLGTGPADHIILGDTTGILEVVEDATAEGRGFRYRVAGFQGTDLLLNVPRPSLLRVDGRETRDWRWRAQGEGDLGNLEVDRPAGVVEVEVSFGPTEGEEALEPLAPEFGSQAAVWD